MFRSSEVGGRLVMAFVGLLFSIQSTALGGDWPQWRGPDRTNVSKETGLLKVWPKTGPPLLWKAEGLGEGVASVAVANGRVITLGYRGADEFATALDVKDGKRLWSTRIGPAVKEASVMRWLSQRTPTIDGDRLYALTAHGALVCLECGTGKEQWRRDYVNDFKGQRGRFGYCDYPIVVGEKLICVPGGSVIAIARRGGIMTCINFKTGKVLMDERIKINENTVLGSFALTFADARFYLRDVTGKTALVAATPNGLEVKGVFDPPRPSSGERSGVFPVVSDGRLFLRDMDWLLCYDVKDQAQGRRGPRPPFVP